MAKQGSTILNSDRIVLVKEQKQSPKPLAGLGDCMDFHRNAPVDLEVRPCDYTLISTSTPQGSSSFISASTVLAVEL